VTKNKVGYRLREVLNGKSKPMRQKDSEGNDIVIKAYEFDPDKLRKVARKYGYEFVTKLPSEPSSGVVQAPKCMEKEEGKNEDKGLDNSKQLGKLCNLVTSEIEPSSPPREDSSTSENAVGKESSNSVTTVQEALEYVRSRFVEGTEEEWIGFVVDAGLSVKEAESLFESLKGSELFWFERDGQTFWRWVRE